MLAHHPQLGLMACLVSLQPSSTYLMIWVVVDCASFLTILWAFFLLKYVRSLSPLARAALLGVAVACPGWMVHTQTWL